MAWQYKRKKDAVVLVLGSGVGGGVILDGKLHRGVNLSAGEISYVMSNLDPNTKETSFMGALGSGALMVRRIAEVKQLDDLTDGEAVFNYINNGDVEAMKIFDEFCIHVAGQILNLQYILDPEIFAIGGGVSAQRIVLERIKWAVGKLNRQTRCIWQTRVLLLVISAMTLTYMEHCTISLLAKREHL